MNIKIIIVMLFAHKYDWLCTNFLQNHREVLTLLKQNWINYIYHHSRNWITAKVGKSKIITV